MSRTVIKVGAVIDASRQINSAKSTVSSAKNSFSQIKNNVDGKILNRSNLRNRMNTTQRRLSNIDSKLSRINSTVNFGANQYRATDNKVDGWKKNLRNNVGAKNVTGISGVWASMFKNDDDVKELEKKQVTDTAKKEKKSLWDWGNTWDVIGSFGPIGAGVSAAGQLFTEDNPYKAGISFGKGLIDIVGDVAGTVSSKTSFDWKVLTGLNSIADETAKDVVADAIDDFKFSKATGTAGKVSVAAKWAGTALTVAGSAVDNIEEYKNGEISVGRAIAETVGESAVKVATGVACKAAATAIVTGVAATVGAPAIATAAAVGVVAVGISWAADKVCEAFTGKNVAEAVSDVAIDTVKKVGKAVGSAAKAVTGKVSGWWKKLWK